MSSTRAKSKPFLFEDSELKENISAVKFATKEEIILHYAYRRILQPKYPAKYIIGCSRSGPTGEAPCTGQSACPFNCILFSVKKPWIDGGYEKGIESDFIIRGMLEKLIKQWEDLKKSKSKITKNAEKSRKEFKKQSKKVLWFGKKNIREILKNTGRDKDEFLTDIEFLKDQKNSRKMTLGSKDKTYNIRLAKRMKRKQQYLDFLEKNPNSTNETAEFEFTSGASSSEDNSSLEYDEETNQRLGKENVETETESETATTPSSEVTLTKDFVKEIALTGASRGISSRSLLHVCTNLIVASGGDVQNYTLSESTIRRHKKVAISKAAEAHRNDVIASAQSAKFPIIVHFDGKLIQDITNNDKTKKDRFAILINIDGKIKLLGIPGMESAGAEAQHDCLIDALYAYDLTEKVHGIVFDTTAANTGRISGTNIRFSRSQGKVMLELACRHHVFELHIKHFSEPLVSRKTVAPENQLFKQLQNSWQQLKHSLDQSKFKTYDLKSVKGTFLENEIFETVRFCKMALSTEVFSRGDYQELLQLTLMYLCPEQQYKIRAPGNVSHARFMSKAIYYLKIAILAPQLGKDMQLTRMYR